MTGEFRSYVNPYIRYLEVRLEVAKRLANEALEEEGLAKTRPARQHWVGQHTYWSERASHLQRRLEEERNA